MDLLVEKKGEKAKFSRDHDHIKETCYAPWGPLITVRLRASPELPRALFVHDKLTVFLSLP